MQSTRVLSLTEENLADFSRQNTSSSVTEEDDNLSTISSDTNVTLINLEQKNKPLDVAGKIITVICATGCGINGAAALASISVLAGTPFLILGPILGFAVIYSYYRMTNHDVSNIFIGGIKGLFKNDIVEETIDTDDDSDKMYEGKYLSKKKSLMLAGGVILSAIFAMYFAALTYSSTLALATTFSFLGAVSFALPPVGIVLAAVTFVCFGCLMTKGFSDIIKIENKWEKIKTIFANAFPKRPAGKSKLRFYCERALPVTALALLTTGILGLVIYGQIVTLQVCGQKLASLVSSVSRASTAVIEAICVINAVVLGVAAQIPFILKTSMTPIIALFKLNPKTDQESKALVPEKEIKTFKQQAANYLLLTTAGLSAIATGTIPLIGKALTLIPIMAATGAALNSFFGNVVNAMLSEPVHHKAITDLPANSTTLIQKQLINRWQQLQQPLEIKTVSYPSKITINNKTYLQKSDVTYVENPRAERNRSMRKI